MSKIEYNQTGTGQRDFIRLGAIAGLVTPPVFVLGFTLLGLVRPGYSALDERISNLGVGSLAWLQNLDFILSGLALLLFDRGLYQALQPVVADQRKLKTNIRLLAISALGVVVVGIFPTLVNFDNPTPLGIVSEVLHSLGAYACFGCFSAGVIRLAGQIATAPGWNGYSRYFRIAGWLNVALIFSPLIIPLLGLVIGTEPAIDGLLERILVIQLFSWYCVVGWRLWQLGQA